MAEPPDQSNQVIPKDFAWPAGETLDTESLRQDLRPVLDIPPPREVRDHTGSVAGYGAGVGGTHQDVLTELGRADQLRLLKANGIDLDELDGEGRALMRAYTLGRTLEPANRYGLRAARVTCRPNDGNRQDGQSLSFSEVTSNLERQTVASTSGSASVPGLFKVDASFSSESARAERSHSVRVFFQASQVIPKAIVSVAEEDVSLEPALVERVRAAVGRGDAEGLLDVLADWGHFVPTNLVLGGRITLHSSTEMDDSSSYDALRTQFGAAARARLVAEGVPVEGGAGAGRGSTERSDLSTVQQSKELRMELKGGTESLGSSEPGTLGTKWIDSVGSFLRWRTIGFAPRSLVPVIHLLDADLETAVLDLLRGYVRSRLSVVRTDVAGDRNDDTFGPDDATLARVRRLTEIVVNHGENVDGLRWTHELRTADGGTTTEEMGAEEGRGFGRWRGEHTTTIRLRADERVVAIEAGCEPGGGLRRLAIRTTRERHPEAGFFGRSPGAREVRTIRASRTVGLHGFKATLVHGLGLVHLRLSDDTHSPEFLESIERLLFPARDYGPLDL